MADTPPNSTGTPDPGFGACYGGRRADSEVQPDSLLSGPLSAASAMSGLGQLRTPAATLSFIRFRGQSGSRFRATGGLLLANSGLKPLRNINLILTHRDAAGGSRRQY